MEKLKKQFGELVKLVEDKKKENTNNKPVFDKVPAKLRDFASKTADAILDVKAKLSFDNIPPPKTRSNGLADNEEENVTSIVTWLVSMLKHVLEKIDQQGDIITVHTEALANPKEALDDKDEEIAVLRKEIEETKLEADETRQRGMKGNLIISSPHRTNKPTRAVYGTVGDGVSRKKESHTDVVKRLIKEKTGIEVKDSEISACHPMGKKENNTFIIRLNNRSPGSSWEKIIEGMKKDGCFVKEVNVFINFMLTKRRADLAKKARTAKIDHKISKLFIDQNGRIKVKKEGDKDYFEVKTEENLYNYIH